MRKPKPTSKNGHLVVNIERSKIDFANPDTQVIVALFGGNEVARVEPESSVPKGPATTYKYWWSLALVMLPDSAAFPLEVHVVDRPTKSKCVWIVTADGTAKHQKK